MEKRTTPTEGLEIRSLVGDLHIESRDTGAAGRTIVGYAAKFECWSEPIMGWFREKIARGAFDGCDMQDVIMCFNHRDDAILARTTSGTLRLEVETSGYVSRSRRRIRPWATICWSWCGVATYRNARSASA